jgi:hypothetical protein
LVGTDLGGVEVSDGGLGRRHQRSVGERESVRTAVGKGTRIRHELPSTFRGGEIGCAYLAAGKTAISWSKGWKGRASWNEETTSALRNLPIKSASMVAIGG